MCAIAPEMPAIFMTVNNIDGRQQDTTFMAPIVRSVIIAIDRLNILWTLLVLWLSGDVLNIMYNLWSSYGSSETIYTHLYIYLKALFSLLVYTNRKGSRENVHNRWRSSRENLTQENSIEPSSFFVYVFNLSVICPQGCFQCGFQNHHKFVSVVPWRWLSTSQDLFTEALQAVTGSLDKSHWPASTSRLQDGSTYQ